MLLSALLLVLVLVPNSRELERDFSWICFYTEQHPGASSLFSLVSGGTSMAGFPLENPSGFNVNPVLSQGMTGKSVKEIKTKSVSGVACANCWNRQTNLPSTRGRCVTPKECHNTTSSPSPRGALRSAIHVGNPPSF